MNAVLDAVRRRPAPEEAVVCTRCASAFRPRLTGWSCPVCDLPVPGRPSGALPGLGPDDRMLLVVGLATLANVLLLALLTLAVLRAR